MANKHEAWQFWYKEKGALLEESDTSTLRKIMEAYLAGYEAAEQSVHPTVATVAAQEVNLDARNSG